MDVWRETLRQLIEDTKEKRRIANAIGILSMRTLDRWVEGSSTPKNNQVIRKLGQENPQLDEQLQRAFPDAFKPSQDSFPRRYQTIDVELPQQFYSRILHAYATMSSTLKHWTITNLVLEQMIDHLDPDSLGIAVVFAQCIAERPDTVSYLLARDAGGGGCWDTRQLVSQCQWGSGSLIGAVANDKRPYIIQALDNDSPHMSEVAFFFQKEKIASLAAYPIQREGALAGVLIICANQPDFFTSPRRKLIEEYAKLYGLAYSDRDFYAKIALANLEALLSSRNQENTLVKFD